MNISQHLVRVRDCLDDPNSTKYEDAEIVRHTDEQARTMFRKQTQQNREWHNFTIALQSSDARQLWQSTWEWRLPTWIDRVVKVFKRDNTATTETTFSPYLWDGTTNLTVGAEIPKTDITRRHGWSWEGQHTLRLWNYTEAPDLYIMVCKVPPPMFRAKILTAYAVSGEETTGLYLPQTTNPANWFYGDQSMEEGVYVNGEIQVTQTIAATSTNLGAIRRISYSQPNAIVSATRQYALRLETALDSALAVNDYVETLLPVPDAHARLLVLLTLNALFVKKNNIDAMKGIAGELAKEWSEFVQYATMPRDNAGPAFKVSARSSRRRLDRDHAPLGNWYYG